MYHSNKEITRKGVSQMVQHKLRMDKNHETQKRFNSIKQKFLVLAEEYSQRFSELNEDAEELICSNQYAKGGMVIHRGYYSPSLLDMVVGGMRRGKILPKKPVHYDYSYHFDADGKLICVHKMDGRILDVEFLQYRGNSVLSFEYAMWNHPLLHFISECIYNEENQMVCYMTALCNGGRDSINITEINVESYRYDNEGSVIDFSWERCCCLNGLTNKSIYSFERDRSGNIVAYTVDNCDGREKRRYSTDLLLKVKPEIDEK